MQSIPEIILITSTLSILFITVKSVRALYTAIANNPPVSWTLTEIDTLTGSYISTLATQNGNRFYAYDKHYRYTKKKI
ncbi:MAG: hypothetical protein IPH57_03975 [Saprospiraceae bacterium]|nr:hypothetical protein [Saprospiraceae bacterium]